MKSRITRCGLMALACLVSSAVWAGRPLGTDDAGTAEKGKCQVEAWQEATEGRSGHSLVVAPACGIAEGVELGMDYTLPYPQETVRANAGLALKVVPESWQIKTGMGDLNFGIKLSTSMEEPTDANWRGTQSAVLGLATLRINDAWTLHANLGTASDRATGATARLMRLAAVWAPHERWLVFAETLGNDRHDPFGQVVNTLGTRWWLVPEKVGLDLTASQNPGSTRTTWSIGLGWYGIGF